MWFTSAGQAPIADSSRSAPPPLPLASLSFSIASRAEQQQPPLPYDGQRFLVRPRAPLPLASVHAAALAPADANTEQHTGVAFPGDYCVHTRSHCPELTGTGVRAKRVLGLKNVNVYALGLYVDGPAAKRALRSAGAPSPSNQRPFDALIGSGGGGGGGGSGAHSCEGVERTLRLVITTNLLNRAKFVSTLEERLGPALRAAGEAPTFDAFARLFDGVAFKSGTEIVFSTKGGGKLATRIDGREKAPLQSRALCESLLDIYLGKDPVSPEAKRAFGEGLAAMMRE